MLILQIRDGFVCILFFIYNDYDFEYFNSINKYTKHIFTNNKHLNNNINLIVLMLLKTI